MKPRRALIIATWLIGIAVAAWIVARAHYVTDLSAFLPAKPTPAQKALVEQLRNGPSSRLVLVALQDGEPNLRARISAAMAQRLRNDAEFSHVDNGEPVSAERDRDFLFQHRYLLSDAVTPQHFSVAGLRVAIGENIENLASSAGLMLKSLMPHDPTGEMLNIVAGLQRTQGPRIQNGTWVSTDGARTLLIAQTAATGSDTDGQERALGAITAAFRAGVAAAGPAASVIRLKMSGPGVFAVAARSKIKRAATRLSVISSVLVVGLLLAVYRSLAALGLGLLPVATGALSGVAAVALGFGAVHGITLGFGITLIGESVDYSIYFFIRSLRTGGRLLWPTIRLGMLTSVCGFASLLPSGFPGLAQLGLYSISGLLAAALVTRFVLPELLPRQLPIRDVTPLGLWIGRRRDAVRRHGPIAIAAAACALAVLALSLLVRHRATLWNHDLSALSPLSPQEQRYDAQLRADLGAPDTLDLVVVEADTLESALQGAEHAATALQPLVDEHVIGGFDSPTGFLPSAATQQRRRDSLPGSNTLRANLAIAAADLGVRADQLTPFIGDVESAGRAPLLTAQDLRGTSLAAGLDALLLHGPGRWTALMPLHAVSGAAGPGIDLTRVERALAAARLDDTRALDLKFQTDALYASYLREAIRLSVYGFGLIVLLLLVALRSPLRVAGVLAPLVLAVLCVAAGLVICGRQLTILHLVGMLLIVAVGSNYALFFDDEGSRQWDEAVPLTLASLAIANLSTVIGFGLLSFSQVPVLEALGETVAPGAFLALMFSAVMTSPLPRTARSANSARA